MGVEGAQHLDEALGPAASSLVGTTVMRGDRRPSGLLGQWSGLVLSPAAVGFG